MTYMNKNAELRRGYNVYIDADADDFGTQMDVGHDRREREGVRGAALLRRRPLRVGE